MPKSKIIAIALGVYLIIMVAGGASYYAYSLQNKPVVAEKSVAAPAPKKESASPKEEPPQPTETKKAIETPTEDDKDNILKTLTEDTVNGITYYHYKKEKQPPSGIYLYPSVAESNTKCDLRLEVYYFYSIDDAKQTAWIFGDRADIDSGNKSTTLILSPKGLVKHMAKDASYLSESHTITLKKSEIGVMRDIAANGGGTITYYKIGGKARTEHISREDARRLRDTIKLYDIINAEYE